MKLSRQHWIALGLIAVVAVVVIVLIAMNLSALRQRTVTLDLPRSAKTADEAESRKQVEQRLATYRKAGEPILVGDFAPKPVPAAQNAADPLKAAMRMLQATDNDPAWALEYSSAARVAKLSPEQWQKVEALVARFGPALAKVDEADPLTAVDWGIKYQSPALYILLPSLNGARQLQNALHLTALADHRAGRHDQAIKRITQMKRLADRVEEHPALVGHLVALALARVTAEAVAEVAPTLRIGTAPGEATPQQVKALIAALLDENAQRGGLRRAMLSERMSAHDTISCLLNGKLRTEELTNPTPTATTRPATSPAAADLPNADLLADLVDLLDHNTALLAASSADRWPDFQRAAPAVHQVPLRTHAARALLPALDRAVNRHYVSVGTVRVAATALAARLWSFDHAGAAPPALDVLVPQYLSVVPADPLARAPATILFRVPPETPAVYVFTDPARRPATTAPGSNDFVIKLR